MLGNQYCTYTEVNFLNEFPLVLNPGEKTFRVLMLGDVIGRHGRKIVKSILPSLKKSLELDFITVNGENISGGFGITETAYQEMMSVGVSVITMGNHWKKKPEVHTLRRKFNNIIIPMNIPEAQINSIPSYIASKNKTVHVINLMGQYAMHDEYHCPFQLMQEKKESVIEQFKEGNNIFLLDMHAEASSEKQAMAWFMDGYVAGLIGTHTHAPTSDERITENGTAFLTDVGMTGGYESVIGMNIGRSLSRFIPPKTKQPQEVASKDLWFCAFLLEIDLKTNLSVGCHRLQFRENNHTWTVSSVYRPAYSTF